MSKIAKPTQIQIEMCLKEWANMANYVSQESSLKKLFTKTYPLNKKLDDVLIKVCSLNDFYSTNIFSPFTVANHIISLKIDQRLAKDDLIVVNDIARVKMSGGREWNFYSFATKYCSHHKPRTYPIYDNYVEKMLIYFKKADNFFQFKKADLKNYSCYREVIIKFREFYSLSKYDLKQIDRYLWIRGKEYFQK